MGASVVKYIIAILLLAASVSAQPSLERRTINLDKGSVRQGIKERHLTATVDSVLEITAWGDDCRLRIKHKKHPFPNMRDTVYERPDGLEWEIILDEKPASNELTYQIETEGLVFLYQDTVLDSEKSWVSRADSVIGSYAIYHAFRRNDYLDAKFGTGKFGHAFRPFAFDALGDTVWCILWIDEKVGEWVVVVPQKFLDNAVYPVVIGPTIGYTSGGGTAVSISSSASYINWYDSVATGAGTTDSAYAYMWSFSGGLVQVGIYEDSVNDNWSFKDSSAQMTVTGGFGSPVWEKSLMLIQYSLQAGQKYVVAIHGDNSGQRIMGDAQSGAVKYYGASTFPEFLTPQDATGGTAVNFQISMYVTYVAAAGPTGPPDYLHGPDGAGQLHGPDGASKLHGP